MSSSTSNLLCLFLTMKKYILSCGFHFDMWINWIRFVIWNRTCDLLQAELSDHRRKLLVKSSSKWKNLTFDEPCKLASGNNFHPRCDFVLMYKCQYVRLLFSSVCPILHCRKNFSGVTYIQRESTSEYKNGYSTALYFDTSFQIFFYSNILNYICTVFDGFL